MKNSVYLILLLIVCLCSCFLCRSKEYPEDDFYADFWSENNRINATLYLDVFNQDLENLTYEYYLNYLKNNLAPSAEGLPDKIEAAGNYYFETKQTSFMILLLYEDEKKSVADIASTAFLDTLLVMKENDPVPGLKDVADMLDF